MPRAFGADGAALLERLGSLAQVARVDSFTEDDGPERGARRVRLVNGGGLEIEVHPDRALDLGRVTVDGVPVAWLSPPGMAAPALAEREGGGWLRTFGGGLLATCGLDAYGPAGSDADGSWGQHGRVGSTPARVTRAETTDAEVVLEGIVRQTGVFAENLVLRRRISSPLGSDLLLIEDEVTNEGFAEVPHMVLYHLNLGWPLLDEGTVVEIPSDDVRARDADAEAGAAEWNTIPAPIPGFREQVFMHTFDSDGSVTVRVGNTRLGLTFVLTFDAGSLPGLSEWKMTGQGHYALGIEPSNTPHFGRADARAAGALPTLAPGASASYRLALRLTRGTAPETPGGSR
ncbi:MAG TPA: aldose 1-epimerase family protein [Naasia sp.]|jgi:hypothetical protein